jgi:ribosomal protein S18 acetylase RimI-like enzyme
MTSPSVELIRQVETLAANAWPAGEVQLLDGWRLRYQQGLTRRANSVWPNETEGRLTLHEKLAKVEAFYAQRQLPARYQTCPAAQPPDLDDILAERGYRLTDRTCVQTASLSAVLERTLCPSACTMTVGERFSDLWLATYCQAERCNEQEAVLRRDILLRMGCPTGFALLQTEGQAMAVGLGVLESGWVGVFCMATRPEWRRRSAATGVLHALAHWGEQHAATQMYLQVREDNAGARALYARAGLATLYYYHYREAL